MKPTAIIATWENEERTQGVMLQANGNLIAVERERVSDVWSPPKTIGPVKTCKGAFEAFLVKITRSA